LRPLVWLENQEVEETNSESNSESKSSADSETESAVAASKQQDKLKSLKTWRNLVLGTLAATVDLPLTHIRFTDIFDKDPRATLKQYLKALIPHTGALEYIDPYEQNEASIAMFQSDIKPESTHMEIHPSTILSFMTGMIPFSHHNQSVRNQLGDSQSKQALSIYATNWKNRFDNTANVL
jgi:hypothetical protein